MLIQSRDANVDAPWYLRRLYLPHPTTTRLARSRVHVQPHAAAVARCLHVSRLVQSAALDEVAAKLTLEGEDKATRDKAGLKQMYLAIESVETAAELDKLQAVLAHYRKLNKKISSRMTEKVITACLEHSKPGLAARMIVDKVKYGLFPTVSEYSGLMSALSADPHEDPAQIVRLFETLILERGDEEPNAAIFDLAIDACVRKGDAGYVQAAGELMAGVVMNDQVEVFLSAERHASVAAALVHPGIASNDGVGTAISVLHGHEGGPAALSPDAKGHLAAFVASSGNTEVLDGFSAFSDSFKVEANVQAKRLAEEAEAAMAEAAEADADADADADAEEEGDDENGGDGNVDTDAK